MVATAPLTRAGRFAAWDKALRRAIAANLTVLDLGNGSYAISSESDQDRGYVVNEHFSCTCAAAQNGNPYCKHAALAMALSGILDWPDFTADAPAAPVEVECSKCRGNGSLWSSTGWVACPRCNCHGRVAA